MENQKKSTWWKWRNELYQRIRWSSKRDPVLLRYTWSPQIPDQ